MSDPKWEERLIPVMSNAVTALSCLISEDLFDKLLEREFLNFEQHDLFIKKMRDPTSSQSGVARDLFTMLRRHPHPSFSDFCSVIKKVHGGNNLLRILTPSSSSKKSNDKDSASNVTQEGEEEETEKDSDPKTVNVSASENIFLKSQPAERNSEFKIVLHLEADICLPVAAVTASNVGTAFCSQCNYSCNSSQPSGRDSNFKEKFFSFCFPATESTSSWKSLVFGTNDEQVDATEVLKVSTVKFLFL